MFFRNRTAIACSLDKTRSANGAAAEHQLQR